MSEMMLEQVRDWHREQARNIRAGITTGSAETHSLLADAIDAALQSPAQGGVVPWGYANGDVALSVDALKDCRHSNVKWNVPLYTAPPTAAAWSWEDNDYVVRGHFASSGAVSIESITPKIATPAAAVTTLTDGDRDLLRAAAGFCKGDIGRCDPVRMDAAVNLILRIAALATPAEPSIPVSKVREMLTTVAEGITRRYRDELTDRILVKYAGAGE